jgi:mannose-6-phosphate isomerase-like protein (cupin superfamily)
VEKVNLLEKFALLSETYVPKIVGELNGQYVKIVRFVGPYVWHDHQDEDEMFLVLEGHIRIEFRGHVVELDKGEFLIVPRGVEHRPVANQEALILLFEPASTVNTGQVEHDYTIASEDLERLS